jgi:hypothetical protein
MDESTGISHHALYAGMSSSRHGRADSLISLASGSSMLGLLVPQTLLSDINNIAPAGPDSDKEGAAVNERCGGTPPAVPAPAGSTTSITSPISSSSSTPAAVLPGASSSPTAESAVSPPEPAAASNNSQELRSSGEAAQALAGREVRTVPEQGEGKAKAAVGWSFQKHSRETDDWSTNSPTRSSYPWANYRSMPTSPLPSIQHQLQSSQEKAAQQQDLPLEATPTSPLMQQLSRLRDQQHHHQQQQVTPSSLDHPEIPVPQPLTKQRQSSSSSPQPASWPPSSGMWPSSLFTPNTDTPSQLLKDNACLAPFAGPTSADPQLGGHHVQALQQQQQQQQTQKEEHLQRLQHLQQQLALLRAQQQQQQQKQQKQQQQDQQQRQQLQHLAYQQQHQQPLLNPPTQQQQHSSSLPDLINNQQQQILQVLRSVAVGPACSLEGHEISPVSHSIPSPPGSYARDAYDHRELGAALAALQDPLSVPDFGLGFDYQQQQQQQQQRCMDGGHLGSGLEEQLAPQHACTIEEAWAQMQQQQQQQLDKPYAPGFWEAASPVRSVLASVHWVKLKSFCHS